MRTSTSAARAHRLTVALVVGLVSVAVFAAAGLAGKAPGKAQSGVGLSQYEYGQKVEVCHKGKRTLRIGRPALPAHLRHGDTVGACAEGVSARKAKQAEQADEADESATTSSGSHGKGNGKGQGKSKGGKK